MTQRSADDDPRDAHLVAALRHAPDRDLVPPAQVTAAILGHARQALRARPAGMSSAWRAAWARLWQPAPMTAFGTLAMATLIGLLWSGSEMPDATPSLRSAPAAVPAEASAAGSTAAVPAQEPAARAAEVAAVDARAAKSMPLPATKAPSLAKPAPPPASPTPAAMRQAAAQEPEPRSDAAATTATAAATPAPAAAPAAVPTAAPVMPLQRDALGKSMADAAQLPARARSEMAAPAVTAAPPAPSPLGRVNGEIDAAVNAAATRVRWRVAPDRLVVHDAAQRDWWSALDRATQGRWQTVAAGSLGAGAAEATSLTLLIDGAPRGSLNFEPQAVVWRDTNGVAWRALVAGESLRALQEATARW